MITARQARTIAEPIHKKNCESQLNTIYNSIEVESERGLRKLEWRSPYYEVIEELRQQGYNVSQQTEGKIKLKIWTISW